MDKKKFNELSEEEHMKGIISMALYGTASLFFFAFLVGLLEWLF